MSITREQVLALKVGDRVRTTFDIDGLTGKVRPGAVWSNWKRVVSIRAQSQDVKGTAFACFCLESGKGGKVFDSVKEDETFMEIQRLKMGIALNND